MSLNTINIKLKNASDISEFCHICNNFSEDIDCMKGRYVIDAKSFLGVSSIELGSKITVKIHSDNVYNIKKLFYALNKWEEKE
jgi:phosphocarrier protein HPr